MKRVQLMAFASVGLLSACAPQVEAQRTMAGRLISIRNADDHTFRIERIVANEGRNSESCIDRPARELAPGQTYEVTFMVCGPVVNLEVHTNEGTAHLQW